MAKKKYKRHPKYVKPKDPTFKEWWAVQSEKTQKNLKIAAIAVAVVIVLSLIFYYGIYDDGSLKIRNGAAVGKQDNWLISELDGGKNSDYYHIANVNVPEGMVISDESASAVVIGSTPIDNDFTFKPADETAPYTNVYVRGVAKSVDTMMDSVYGIFTSTAEETGSISDVKTVDTPLGQGKYFVYDYTYENTEENNKVEYNQSMVCYVPTLKKNVCILVSVNNYPETEEGYADEAQLVEIFNKAVAAIELTEK